MEKTLFFKKDDFAEKCSKYAFYALVLYFIDIILLGTGAITKIGFFSTRTFFFGMAGLLSLPAIFRDYKKLLKKPSVLFVIAFFVWMLIGMVRGIATGNEMPIIKSDVLGYTNLLLLPTMLVVLNSEERIISLMRAIAYSCSGVAVIAMVFSYYTFFPHRDDFRHFLTDQGLCALSGMTSVAVRVFLHTGTRYMFIGFLFAFFFLLGAVEKKENKTAIHWCGIMALDIVAIFLSYTRAIYAAVALVSIAAFIYIAINKKELVKKMLLGFAASAACAAILLTVIGLSQGQPLLKISFYRILLSTDLPITSTSGGGGGWFSSEDAEQFATIVEDVTTSGEIRSIKLNLLSESIARDPIFGNGLGVRIDPTKYTSDPKLLKAFESGYVEYFYHDVINKLGLVGLALYAAPFVLVGTETLRRRKSDDLLLSTATFAGIAYFFCIAYFNPCMNTTVGISYYLTSIAILDFLKTRAEEQDPTAQNGKQDNFFSRIFKTPAESTAEKIPEGDDK